MKKTISLFLLLVNCFVLFAQNETDTLSKKNLFIMNLHVGAEFQKYDNLNKVLSENGLATLNQTSFSVGFGYYKLFNKSKFLPIMEFSTYSQTASEQNNTTKIQGTALDFMIGYTILNEQKLQFIPYAGMTYTWVNTKMFTETPNNTTVTGFLSGTANQFEMAANYYLANFGGQATFSPTVDKKTGEKLMIGIRSGYAVPITKTDWKTDNNNLKDGPKIDDGRFYLHFIIGITL
jgi:hypothetical protein